jgi:hypothetical protein
MPYFLVSVGHVIDLNHTPCAITNAALYFVIFFISLFNYAVQ